MKSNESIHIECLDQGLAHSMNSKKVNDLLKVEISSIHIMVIIDLVACTPILSTLIISFLSFSTIHF